MSRDCCVALPRGATGLSAVCVVFPDLTYLLFCSRFKRTTMVIREITFFLWALSLVLVSKPQNVAILCILNVYLCVYLTPRCAVLFNC